MGQNKIRMQAKEINFIEFLFLDFHTKNRIVESNIKKETKLIIPPSASHCR